MKNALFFPILLIVSITYAQQSEIKGVVSIFNSQFETGKKQYISNA